jgi:uncharacterized membrane protein
MAEDKDPKNSKEENKLLREQLKLLQERNRLQEESFDISSSSIDSLRELMGIKTKSNSFERSTLKINQDIHSAILNQKTGLSDVNTIQKQIQKNQDLLKKSKLIESSLEKSIGGNLTAKGERMMKVLSLQKGYIDALEGSNNLSQDEISLITQKLAKADNLIDQGFQSLSLAERQLIVTKQNTEELEKQQKQRENDLDLQKQIRKQMGLSGAILKGLGEIPGLRGKTREIESEITEELNKQVELSGKLPSRWSTFGQIAGKTLKSLSGSFTDPVTIITGLVSIFSDLDSSAGNYAKSMNVSYGEALGVRKEMSDIALASGDAALNSSRLQETLTAVGETMGSNAKLNEADLKTFTKLREQAGYTNEELMGIQQLSLVNGKSLEENTKEILGGAKAYASRNKLVVNEKQILKDVSKASASLKLTLGGSAAAVAEAAVKAKQFGINLEQAEKMSQSLLNFEESIESELSAELLTGKDLNLERARGLALNGQTADAAAEIAKQVGTSADFAKMNVIQQESIAKAAGMTKDELAQSLMDREALVKLGAKEGQDAQARYDEMRAAGKSEADIAVELGDAQLAKQYEQQSIQEEFNQTMLSLKETLVNGILPAFTSIGGFLKDNIGLVKTLVGLFLALKAITIAYNAVKQVSILLGKKQKAEEAATAAAAVTKGAFSSLGMIPFVGALLAAAAVGAGLGILFSSMGKGESMKDGMIGPDGGMIVSGQKGSIQLDKNDSLIAGTSLLGNNKQQPQPQYQQPQNNSSDMKDLKSAIMALASRPVNVEMDGEKVIKATTGKHSNTRGDEIGKNNYKIQ